MRKKIILLVIALALLLHAGGLFLLHKIPIRFASFAMKKIGSDAMIGENEREEWVKEMFDTLQDDSQIVKEELKDLNPEELPSLLLAFPQAECLADTGVLMPNFPDVVSDFSDSPPLDLLLQSEKFSLLENHEESGAKLSDFSYVDKEEKESIAESDHFHVNVEFLPRRQHLGYLFKVTLVPKQQIAFKRIRENYFFLIDRSNSIIRGRYLYNKRAISEALSFLKQGDHFNILIFDDKVVRLSREPLAWTEENVKLARNFLDEEGHGGYFALTDIYASLGKILPQDVPSSEINTAILLSDGDTYLPIDKQRQLIGRWSAANGGKTSLFCIASGSGNNLPLLEILSTFNKGELLYVSKHEQVRDRLKQLVLSLQHPIGKKIVATAISQVAEMSIFLQPKNHRLPDLYKNRPYTIFGYTNKLSDFTLFIQGSYYDRKFDIKKRITFDEAKMGTLFLEREWAQWAALEYYERYFQDGKACHLESVKQLLAPLNVSVPFLR